MAYKKRKFVRKGKPRAPKDTGLQNAMTIAKKAYSGYKFLKGLINTEYKKFYTSNVNQNIVFAGLIYNLSNIAQGNDYNNRNGNSILGKTLDVNYQISGDQTMTARLLIIQDTENDGTDPTLAQVFETVAGANVLTTFLQKDNGRRFTILVDDRYTFNPGYSGVLQNFHKQHHIVLNNHLKYDATTGADASNKEGALFCIAFSNQATTGPGFNMDTKLSYIDN